jgi:hypothetical protein
MTTKFCRCGSRIRQLPGYSYAWAGERGDRWCENGEAHRPKPGCPPSEVVDQIIPWFEVQEGEAVLYNGQLHELVCMWPWIPGTPQVGIRLMRESETRDYGVDSNDYAAVRRYVEG